MPVTGKTPVTYHANCEKQIQNKELKPQLVKSEGSGVQTRTDWRIHR